MEYIKISVTNQGSVEMCFISQPKIDIDNIDATPMALGNMYISIFGNDQNGTHI